MSFHIPARYDVVQIFNEPLGRVVVSSLPVKTMPNNISDLVHFGDICDVVEGPVDFDDLAQKMKDGEYMQMPAPFRPKEALTPHTAFNLAVLKVPNSESYVPVKFFSFQKDTRKMGCNFWSIPSISFKLL